MSSTQKDLDSRKVTMQCGADLVMLYSTAGLVQYLITKQYADTWHTLTYIATAQMIRLIVVTRGSAKRIAERIADVQAVDCPDCPIKPQP